MIKNAIIVLAAGQGKRMGRGKPKMLLEVLGKPLLYWTLKNLDSCPNVHAIVAVVPPARRSGLEVQIRRWGFRKVCSVAGGGKERVDSARNGLLALPVEYGWVGIHDGARPFVSHRSIQMCFREARKTGAAILAVPSKETIKMARGNGMIQETVPRDRCWAAQTPQVFRREIAEKIHRFRKGRERRACTDDAILAEKEGIQVKIVTGSYENIKITNPQDLFLAEKMLRSKG